MTTRFAQAAILTTVAAAIGAAGWGLTLHNVGAPHTSRTGAPSRAARPLVDDRFAPGLVAVAAEYRSYGWASRTPGWAPTMCRPPSDPAPQVSRAAGKGNHGGKLYFLYAAHRDAYLAASEKAVEQPAGQVVVKETWRPRRVPSGKGDRPPIGAVKGAGGLYTPGEKGPLFIMFKPQPVMEGTDDGWVYGTVTADGGTVTAAGRLASCMGCHQRGTRDRLFGPR